MHVGSVLKQLEHMSLDDGSDCITGPFVQFPCFRNCSLGQLPSTVSELRIVAATLPFATAACH